MRPAVDELVGLGQFPPELDATEEEVARREILITKLRPPATDGEARALLRLFGDDSLFGLAWSLVAMIESAPGWPFWDELTDTNPWHVMLRQSAINAGYSPAS